MSRLPFLKFFPNDWLAEPTIRVCSVAARGLWMDMLSLMHLSPRRGYLLAATGSPISPEQLARLTGCSADEVTRLLAELRSSGVFNCTDDGTDTIYSRRMVRDEGKREKCGDAGRRGGGNPTFKGVPKGAPKGTAKGGPKLPEARGQKPDNSPSGSPAASPADAPAVAGKVGRKGPDSPHHRCVDAFCSAWQTRHGMPYPFNGGKDGDAVKAILAAVGGDEGKFAAVVGRYLADPDPFVAGKRHPLGLLRSQLTTWLVEGSHGGGTAGGVGKGGRVQPRPGAYSHLDGPGHTTRGGKPPPPEDSGSVPTRAA